MVNAIDNSQAIPTPFQVPAGTPVGAAMRELELQIGRAHV